MLYKNNRTGAIIDTPCIIAGGDWVPYTGKMSKIEIKVREVENKVTEEESEDVIELSQMTVNNLKRLAAEHDIDLGDASKKDDIIKVIMESDAFEIE